MTTRNPLIENRYLSNPSSVRRIVDVLGILSFCECLKVLAGLPVSRSHAPFRHIKTARIALGSHLSRKVVHVSETLLRHDDPVEWFRLAKLSVDRNETPYELHQVCTGWRTIQTSCPLLCWSWQAIGPALKPEAESEGICFGTVPPDNLEAGGTGVAAIGIGIARLGWPVWLNRQVWRTMART